MGVTATEQIILEIIGELKQATGFQISRATGLSPGYVEYLCRYLIRSGYLRSLGQGRYALAPSGKKLLVSLGWGIKFDKASVKALASQVAKEVSLAIRQKGARKEIVREKVIYRAPREGERKKIEIKTDFFPLVTDETVGLESNIGKVGTKVEKEGAQTLDTSVQLLKNLQKSKLRKRYEKGKKH